MAIRTSISPACSIRRSTSSRQCEVAGDRARGELRAERLEHLHAAPGERQLARRARASARAIASPMPPVAPVSSTRRRQVAALDAFHPAGGTLHDTARDADARRSSRCSGRPASARPRSRSRSRESCACAASSPVAVSADALQVYAGLELLTGAAGAAERAELEHRLISFLPVDAVFSAGQYAELAHAEIDELLASRAAADRRRRHRPLSARSADRAEPATAAARGRARALARGAGRARAGGAARDSRQPSAVGGGGDRSRRPPANRARAGAARRRRARAPGGRVGAVDRHDAPADAAGRARARARGALRADRRARRRDARGGRAGGGPPRRAAPERASRRARRSASRSCSPATSTA